MRFLFTISPATGHFHAMVPLALAVKERGHELAFATGKSFRSAVQRAGFQHFPCGFDFDGSQDILQALPEWQACRAKAPDNPALQQLHGFVSGLGPRMAVDLLELVKEWRPDAIVRDPLEFGGAIAAEVHKIPHAATMWATYIPASDLVPEAVSELRQRFDLSDDPESTNLDRYLVLDFLPPSWAFPDLPYPQVAHRFCAPPFDLRAGSRLPSWFEALPDQPTVYATLGTTFNQAPDLFKSILTSFHDLPVNLVVTVGNYNDPQQFGPQPDHIHVERYIPQTLVLPYCNALIFHGGFNTLISAFWHALPMVVIPGGGGDQLPTARRCAAIGAGVMVSGEPPEPGEIQAAVMNVLEQASYRQIVQKMQLEIKQLPPLAQAVQMLEKLARTGDPQF